MRFLLRDDFFDFDAWVAEELDKVENYRYLENDQPDFEEN